MPGRDADCCERQERDGDDDAGDAPDCTRDHAGNPAFSLAAKARASDKARSLADRAVFPTLHLRHTSTIRRTPRDRSEITTSCGRMPGSTSITATWTYRPQQRDGIRAAEIFTICIVLCSHQLSSEKPAKPCRPSVPAISARKFCAVGSLLPWDRAS